MKDTLQKILVLLIYQQREHGDRIDWQEISNQVYRWNGIPLGASKEEAIPFVQRREAALEVMRATEREDNHSSTTYGTLLGELLPLLNQKEGAKNYSELIDAIVDCLSWSFASNKIRPEALQALRKAILTPEELHEFTAKIKKEEMSCPCGHKFTFGECVTYFYDPDTEKPQIRCVTCVVPDQRACAEPGCDTRVPFTFPSGTKCKAHRGGKKKEEPMVGPEVAPEVFQVLNAARDRARGLDANRLWAAAQAINNDPGVPAPAPRNLADMLNWAPNDFGDRPNEDPR